MGGGGGGMTKEIFRTTKYSKVAKAIFQKGGGHMPPSPPVLDIPVPGSFLNIGLQI